MFKVFREFKFSYAFLIVFVVDLLATSGDITVTWTSPVIPKLYSNDSDVNPLGEPITEDEESWISSLINIGAMVGPFPYAYLSEKFGRKIALLSTAIPFIISFPTLAFAQNINLYYFARFTAGLAVGGVYTVLPMYVSEIAQDSNRGMLTASIHIFWTFGNLLPYVIGPYMQILWFNIVLTCIPVIFLLLFVLIGLESPHYLMNKQPEEARQVLQKLRSCDKEAEEETKNIQEERANIDNEATVFGFLKSKALLISLVLIVTQQFSGINAVLFYTEEIFADAGVSGISPEISSMIIGLLAFFSSWIAFFIVDRFGRKILLLISLLGVITALGSFGVYFYLKYTLGMDVSSFSYLPIVSLVVFIILYNVGIGPVPWIVSSELFPTNVKTYAVAIVAWACWFASFFVTKFFNNLNEAAGEAVTFWLFSGFCFAGLVFTYSYVPETKEKSFQEIQDILKRK